MQNYFNYFTEIEEQFQRRRGGILLLSTVDWALIETWRDAGVPLEAVLRGIDNAFDKHEARKAKSSARRVNGLAWCAQAVMLACEEMSEAAVGAHGTKSTTKSESGFEAERIQKHLQACAARLSSSHLPEIAGRSASEIAVRLREMSAATMEGAAQDLESLDRTLTVLEEKLFAALLTSAPESQLVQLREQAARELAPYRSRMQSVQIHQVEQQFIQKRLLEYFNLPRLSLFYMAHE